MKCYKHPRRTTVLRCIRCDNPICTRCAVDAPVGFQCRACVGGKAQLMSPGLSRLRRQRKVKSYVSVTVRLLVLGAVVGAAIEVHGWAGNPSSAPSFARPLVQRLAPSPAQKAVTTTAGEPVVGPTTSPAGYSFLYVDPKTGAPIRFNPCVPLHYVVNPTGAPAGALTAINQAVAEVSKASGIEITEDEITAEVPSVNRENYLPRLYGVQWAPILIGWVSLGKPAGQQDGFAAVGGPAAAVADGPVWVWTSGAIQINTDADLAAGDLKGVVMHELGHVLGLGHATQPDEVMNPSGNNGATWGPGDLAGLAKVGRAAGCLPEPTPQFN